MKEINWMVLMKVLHWWKEPVIRAGCKEKSCDSTKHYTWTCLYFTFFMLMMSPKAVLIYIRSWVTMLCLLRKTWWQKKYDVSTSTRTLMNKYLRIYVYIFLRVWAYYYETKMNTKIVGKRTVVVHHFIIFSKKFLCAVALTIQQ